MQLKRQEKEKNMPDTTNQPRKLSYKPTVRYRTTNHHRESIKALLKSDNDHSNSTFMSPPTPQSSPSRPSQSTRARNTLTGCLRVSRTLPVS